MLNSKCFVTAGFSTKRNGHWRQVTGAEPVTKMLIRTVFVLLMWIDSLYVGEIVTSSDKIVELVDREKTLLDALQAHINAEYDNLKALSGFLSQRSKEVRTTTFEELRTKAEHPNGAFLLIKLYAQDWNLVVEGNPMFDKHISNLKPYLPTLEDFKGACSAIIRLQRVYKLQVPDMYLGNYSGYQGPPLRPDDAFEIGRQAFIDGFLDESNQWLHLAVSALDEKAVSKKHNLQLMSKRGQAYGLLGRTYVFMNNTAKAKELYDIGQPLDPQSGDILQLEKELEMQTSPDSYGTGVKDWHDDMAKLCMRPKDQRVPEVKAYHTCRYKTELWPLSYVRYKEEILSTSPYTSVFYNVVTDTEIHTLTNYVRGRMFRGLVGSGEQATTTVIRTSDLGWVYDDEIKLAERLSQRVKRVTGLEVDQRTPLGPSSSEAFQIVNYGLGGHYDLHMDPFDDPPEDDLLRRSGERLATFLIYLSDVQKGGNTVFLRSKISVAPQKGMALFWYNFDPKMTKDLDTHHAGCPVLIGHKWIANKWIWTYGNTFRRPCGPSPNSTQLDIEPVMYTSRLHC